MSKNGNSVNIEIANRGYHHGGLREAVVEEGLRLLRTNDAEALSLREIARNVGVSATAIYRHFPDKDALLKALAAAGFAQLGEEQSSVAGRGGKEGFAAIGQAYVRFALENPLLFRLMFSATPAHVHPDVESQKGSAAWLLRTGIASLMPPGASKQAEFAAMLRAWSLVHGLAMLILDKQVDRATAQSMIADIVSMDSLKLA
jgi:AcrR family transcriptional regulator